MITQTSVAEVQSIQARLTSILPDLLAGQPVQLAYLYGSAASGQMHQWSDIDIGVVFEPAAPLDDYQRFMLTISVEADLEQYYKLPTCEVRRIDNAPLPVQGKVVTAGKLLYCKDQAFRIAYETQIRQGYFDFLPMIVQQRDAYFARESANPQEKDSMFDRSKVQSILQNLDEYVGELQQLAQLERSAFLASSLHKNATKYCLQTAVECCIDLNNHLIAALGFRAPTGYADTFVVLGEEGIFDESFVKTARQMVSVRNRLVHLYWAVDNALLYDILQNNLSDFVRYKAFILTFVADFPNN
jgi:uncharacterized protein YutE (UPF0331/DUF86 family)/predicted nucleotidyltransferase